MMTAVEKTNSRQVTVTGMRITPDARDPIWELPPVKGGTRVALIGWVTDADPVDAGVPPLAGEIIARALTRIFRVTFPHPDARIGEGESLGVLEPPRLARLKGNAAIPMFSTTRPESAVRLFDAHPFSWVLKSQVAILSEVDAPAPTLSYQIVAGLLAREPIDERTLVAEAQARGVLAPAVDGDFAALIVFDARLASAVQAALAHECRGARISWEVLTESEFRGR